MIELTGESLSIEQLVAVARFGEKVGPLGEEERAKMLSSSEWVQRSIQQEGKVIYGVNTGFGSLATQVIQPEQARQLSRNLILLCVCGVGQPLPH
jgi:histidine ammonia-lyase